MNKLDFAKFYDITEFAKAHKKEYQEGYSKIFICVDTWDFWIARILEGYNMDYEPEKGAMLLERNNIEKDFKGQGIKSVKELIAVIEQDDFSNWDVYEVDSIEEAIEDYLDDGFGMGELLLSPTEQEKITV